MCNREIPSLRCVVLAVLASFAVLITPGIASAVTLPAGFEQTTAISGLTDPMDVEMTPAGRVFVAEKSGIVKTFSSLSDSTPTVAADLRTQVHNFSARGLMSIAVDPNFPTQPYIYVYYTLDGKIGDTPPLYGDANGTFDNCAKANLGLDENCIVGGRISRIRLSGEVMTGSEQVLVEDWCQQYPFHTGGGLGFGADGYLYFTGGDGSTSTFWDYGQTGTPSNPCGDPPGTIGSLMTSPTAEGGRLRVQDLRTPGDPTGLDGTLIRIDPRTGAGVPGNPLYSSPDANERRILAYGLRDAVRLASAPAPTTCGSATAGADTGRSSTACPTRSKVRNFGWPCYEGGMDARATPTTASGPRARRPDEHLPGPLRRGQPGRDRALGIRPRAEHRAGRALHEGRVSALRRAACCPACPSTRPRAGTSRPVPEGHVLRRPAAQLHFRAAARVGWSARAWERDVVRVRREPPIDLELTPSGDLLYVDQSNDAIHRITTSATPRTRPRPPWSRPTRSRAPPR